ncbi:MAG: NAD(P)-dependent oxidoreductase [Candidatus Micrarchaeota archaeon]|nr:NAD(P)-dependent oxidoreductase [Candidatus Micrarchaeota archaeon]
MDILVTGITSRVGQSIDIDKIIELTKANNIYYLVRNTKLKDMKSNLTSKASSNTSHNYIILDFSDTFKLKQFFSEHDKFDFVIWIASEISYTKTYEELYHTNVKPIEMLSSLCDVKNIVYISSIAVYGEKFNKKEMLTEDSELNPTSNYGKSKLAAENIVKTFSNYVILRPSIIIGKNFVFGFDKVYSFIKTGFFFYPNRKARMPLVHVNDLVDSIYFSIELLSTKESYKDIFNVSSANVMQEELVTYVKNRLKKRLITFDVHPFLAKLLIKKELHYLIDQLVLDRQISSNKIISKGFKFKFMWQQGIDEILDTLSNNNTITQ